MKKKYTKPQMEIMDMGSEQRLLANPMISGSVRNLKKVATIRTGATSEATDVCAAVQLRSGNGQ